ncbi:hypothetical protein KKC94_02000 [Patescibacteria group bacterium]|nr:hypothetical protein [Patescibacteria group bacterium]
MKKVTINSIVMLLVGAVIGTVVTYVLIAGVGTDLQGRFGGKTMQLKQTGPTTPYEQQMIMQDETILKQEEAETTKKVDPGEAAEVDIPVSKSGGNTDTDFNVPMTVPTKK